MWLFSAGLLLAGCSDTKEREAVQPESNLSVDPLKVAFTAEGGNETFHFTTDRGWVISKAGDNWYDITSPVTGEDTEVTVNLTAQPNEGTASRTSKVTIVAGKAVQEVTIDQFGSQPEIILPVSVLEAGFSKATYDILVSSNIQVAATPSETWISAELLQLKSSCTNVYKVKVEGNTGQERSGKIVFSGEGVEPKELIVHQAAFQANLSVTDSKLNITALQTEAHVTIKSNVAWQATLEEGEHNWISIDGNGTGNSGTTTLKFKVDPNPDKAARRCSFTIFYEGLTEPIVMAVVQAGHGSVREQDSLLLVKIWNAATNHGTQSWNMRQPINTWSGVILSTDKTRVRTLEIMGWTFQGGWPAELGWQLEGLWNLSVTNCTFGNAEIPAELGMAENLQELFIAYCSPLDLPEMGQMTALRKLVVRGDAASFQGTVYQELLHPERIGQLKGLTRLELLGTTVTEIPEGVKELTNLEYLSADYSKVTTIPDWIGSLSKLKYLYMEHCQLTGTIPAAIFTGQNLTGVSLGYNKLSGAIPVEAFRVPSLMELRLSENNLTGDLSEELAASNIREFSVRNNRLGTRGATTDLSAKILQDSRWAGSSGTGGGGGGGWFGESSICKQQTGYGWKNCKALD